MTATTSDTLDARELDTRCVPLIQAVRSRGGVPQAELDAIVPSDHSSVDAWLSLYAQLRVWVAMPDPRESRADDADALVTAAIREAPIPVPEIDGFFVYPKSFETLLQIKVLDTQLDRLTARLVTMLGENATLAVIDGAVEVTGVVAYVTCLMVWAWTSEGPGLPFKASDPLPVVPDRITALTPPDLMAVVMAAHRFTESLAACQQLVDPTPARDGGRRPSWAAFFEAMGSELKMDPRELAVTSSITKVLATAYLARDRQQARPDAADLADGR